MHLYLSHCHSMSVPLFHYLIILSNAHFTAWCSISVKELLTKEKKTSKKQDVAKSEQDAAILLWLTAYFVCTSSSL